MVVSSLLFIYVQHLRGEASEAIADKAKVETEFATYKQDQEVLLKEKEAFIKGLQDGFNTYAEGVSDALVQKNEVLDRINDTNRALVDRMRDNTKETITYYKQLPDSDPALIRKLEDSDRSLASCSERVTDLARYSDQVSELLLGTQQTVKAFNESVERLNGTDNLNKE